MKSASISSKMDIRKASPESVQEFLVSHGEKAFRAKQIQEWLWKKAVGSFEEMSNISLATRELLETHYEIRKIKKDTLQKSNDQTLKMTFRLFDGHLIEGVLIPTEDRITACISSQVGCSLACKFCATGYMPRHRNLDAAEIFDQVCLIQEEAYKYFDRPISNIVFMGMGEPLLNYAQVLQGVERITSPQGLHIGAQRITVSTAGVAKMIRKLGDDQVRFNLALSLHAANDEKRNEIMPINETNRLKTLAEALKYYYSRTKNRVTYEYIVFRDFNDRVEDAEELYRFTRHLPSKVNIIEYNPIQEANFINTSEDRLDQFRDYLEERGVIVKVRRSRGKDIDAACGQLAIKEKKH